MGRNRLVYIVPFPKTRRCSGDLIMTTAIASSNLGFKDTGVHDEIKKAPTPLRSLLHLAGHRSSKYCGAANNTAPQRKHFLIPPYFGRAAKAKDR